MKDNSRKQPHIAIRVLRVVAVVYLAALVFALACEKSLIYFPTRFPNGDWGLPDSVREVSFRSSDGETIVAWWFESDKPKGTILFSHWNGGDITIRASFVGQLRREGFSVLLYDYRGYGKSSGSPDEKGLYLDAVAAYDYLRDVLNFQPGKIILLGESLGSAVSVELAKRREVAGLVLLSPFTKFGEMAWRTLPIPVGWALKSRYDSIGKIRNIHTPLAIVHGDRDTLVPIEMGQELYDAHPGTKSFYQVKGAGHNDLSDLGIDEIFRALNFVFVGR